MRVRLPRQFGAPADLGGELGSLQQWRAAVARLRGGRFADEQARHCLLVLGEGRTAGTRALGAHDASA